ncbi:M23 family metallopeptidase [Bradyrhizobium sp. 145]|uniref:M23 family metallopeptidase n=1 Tax=Bradyrhizobium sp. 145 TaxID=2782621 RepID=UPI001FFB7931|nr:M23 family metallopeptidase [Bradyrhizobium sp. 145]MCK1689086.1 M23 family metallopeptidase [Bradyrhizobium sp. 145]
MRTFVSASALYAAVTFGSAARSSELPLLAWPVACELGTTCFIQNYVDHDSSENTLDFRCGHRTYDGHDGTDIRLPDLDFQRRGVEVVAAASGRVARTRDGMDDVSVRILGKAAVAGSECGNGAVIEHGNGWSTQYCHMAKGSLRVKPGDSVSSGQALGLVGLSGNTEFPHIHFTVRHNGAVVDPFAEGAAKGQCNVGRSLWQATVHSVLNYRPTEIINVGFADRAVTIDEIETGEIKRSLLGSRSAAVVAYVRAIGLQAEDEQAIELRSPHGQIIAEYRAPKLPRDQAQYFISVGQKLSGAAWPLGTYTATFMLRRGDFEIERTNFEVKIVR